MSFYSGLTSAQPAGCTAHDGILSILRSFTPGELSALLTNAGLSPKAAITRSCIGHRTIIFLG
jgi:hypothetical protein